jgi:hypothetical protein
MLSLFCLIVLTGTVAPAQNVGIGTATPKARLHVADSSVYFSSPDPLPPTSAISPVETSGIGMLWIAGKAALRVGRETDAGWAYGNVGAYSSSFGNNNLVTGVGSFASGSENTVSDVYSMALGSYNYARNTRTLAFGNYSRALGDYSNAIGYDVASQAYQSTALGRFNILSGNTGTDVLTDPVLVVGNGTADNNRSNALTILKNGNTGIGNVTPSYPLDVKTTTARYAIRLANERTDPGLEIDGMYAYQTNEKGAGIRAFVAAPGSGSATPRNDFSYGIVAQAGTDRYGIGAFSLNKPALLAVSNTGIGVAAESVYGLALSTKGDIQFTQIGEGSGKLLVSDATGKATWQNLSTLTLDNTSATGLSQFEFRNNGAYRGAFGWSQADGRFFFYDGESGTNSLFINNGRIGIRRDATTNALEVGGEASKSTAGSWLGNSDARLKKNIYPVNNALDKLLQLRGVQYEWNDDQTGYPRPQGIQMGFTAQNVQEVFPEKVSTDAQGFLQTAYGTYDPLIVEAIRELKVENDLLKKELEAIKALLLQRN